MTSAAAAPGTRTRILRAWVPTWWRDLAGLLAWGSMLAVLALWVHGGGLTDLLAGGSAALTTAGRLTGLVAADLMLVQVALMARVPFYRASSEDDLVLRGEIRAIAHRRGADVVELPGRRVPGRPSWLPVQAADWDDAEALVSIVPDVAERDVYICGPDLWMEHARAAALRAGVPTDQIHLERFTM
ncbi:hypothetical protein ATJ97_1081 [Georgenia soli]|uniref:Oxidoreductase n=1 Tax=Georgenia soli TaxID=638953 RepID=A0A2A9EI87_9MICO|nr:hypothetical protein [Georgenia soli]PFG38598.1 hypothetical protein ATJ97_1081 [Georgenia soli]